MKHTALTFQGKVLIPKLWLARDFVSRFLGLMGRKGLSGEEGIYFPGCNSIHTCFMRFPIDVVFLDAQHQVVEVIESLPGWRLLWPRRKAKHCIELTSHRAVELGIKAGMKLEMEEKRA